MLHSAEEKAERLPGAREKVLWGYPGKNINDTLPSHAVREG